MAKVQTYIALWLLIVVLLPSAFKVGFISYFYANQAAITQKHCVNKDRPELQCNAKCYLSKQLNQDEPSDPKPTALKFLESTSLTAIVTDLFNITQNLFTSDRSFATWQDHYRYLHLQHIFRPPIG